MTKKIDDALIEVFAYAAHIDDWLTIKKELLRIIPSSERTLFSKCDPITKKQRTNDFERKIAQRWAEMTGRIVLFKDDE